MYKKIYRNMCLLALVTLVLSSLLIIAACYTYFDTATSENIKSTARTIAAGIDQSDEVNQLKKIKHIDGTITLADASGKILYDSDGLSHIHKESGKSSGKVKCSACDKTLVYACAETANGNTVCISTPSGKIPSAFYGILLAVLFIMGLMYILTALASSVLTENIVKPIRKINPLDPESLEGAYEEIRPFLKKIAHQSEEIDRQSEKVTEQKAHLRTVMDNIDEGLVIISHDFDILSANPPALNIFDRAGRDVKYKNYRTLTEDANILNIIKLAISGQKGSIIYDKNERAYEIFYSPVYEKDDVGGAVLLLFDVTERSEAERIRREFTANVSHELKTPLTTIHGYAQIIDKGIAKPEDVMGFASKIEKESSRLMVLVDDIIKLSHLDEGKSEDTLQSISLRKTAGEVVESLARKAEDMEVAITISGEDTEIYANLSQITEMIYNLTDNAIKYNVKGGKVNINIIDKGFEISDTGIGIPSEHLDRIFERFFRVDKSHSKMIGGTGLGLSIVKHIAKVNGGNITVQSTQGQGTTFKVLFA